MGKIFFICGKSASGKDSIYSRLKDELDVKTIVLYTTRPMRTGETDGETYYFVDEKKLEEFNNSGKIIELRRYNTVYGVWKYFTAYDGQFDDKEQNYLVIGTLEALKGYVSYFGVHNVVPIYVEVPDGERLIRAINRENLEENPKFEEICRRFLADGIDFSEENIKNAGITKRYINMDFEKCLGEIEKDIMFAYN